MAKPSVVSDSTGSLYRPNAVVHRAGIWLGIAAFAAAGGGRAGVDRPGTAPVTTASGRPANQLVRRGSAGDQRAFPRGLENLTETPYVASRRMPSGSRSATPLLRWLKS